MCEFISFVYELCWWLSNLHNASDQFSMEPLEKNLGVLDKLNIVLSFM